MDTLRITRAKHLVELYSTPADPRDMSDAMRLVALAHWRQELRLAMAGQPRLVSA